MGTTARKLPYTIFWNCCLIVIGNLIQAIGFKALGEIQGFVPGGLFGTATLIHYLTGALNTGWIYLLMNVPMFIIGYIFLSKRFLAYSSLAMISLSTFFMLVDFQITIQNQLYAAVTFGVIIGAGAGMVLRSLGSNGGLDIAGVILYQKFNIGLGKFFFFYNVLLFSFSFVSLDTDLVIASMIAVFITSMTMDYCLALFNQRKMALVISEQPEQIAEQVMERMKIGATMLPGIGAYKKVKKLSCS
jgi:uncharacterized membrane-anchored protein YitT (DUF2179 family)